MKHTRQDTAIETVVTIDRNGKDDKEHWEL
jgi:hypothetical protein